MNLRDRARQTIVDNRLLDNVDGVLVGLSGGPDSVALLHVLAGYKCRPAIRIVAVYVNPRDPSSRRQTGGTLLCRTL